MCYKVVIELALKQNKNLQKYLLNYQVIKTHFQAKSSNQSIILSIKNFDSGCRWFYRSGYPLEWYTAIRLYFLHSLGLRQSAPINIHPDCSGTLHRILNVGVPDPFSPDTHTKEKKTVWLCNTVQGI